MFRFLIFLLLFLFVIGPIALFFVVVERSPAVSVVTPSTAADATRTRALFREFRSLTETEGAARQIKLTQSDMDSVMAFAVRALPFMRGQARVARDSVLVAVSADATGIPGGGWVNLRVAVDESADGLKLRLVKLGPVSLPATLVLPIAGSVLDIVLGDSLGQIAIKSIEGVSIDDDTVTLGVGLNRDDRKALAKRVKDTVRTAAHISTTDDVRSYTIALQNAAKDGLVAPGSSALPFLSYAMKLANERAKGGDLSKEIQSALHALAIYCGHVKYQNLIGDVVPKDRRQSLTGCSTATMGGRRDLKQHFFISAGLQAASDANIAFTIGEFKELLDSDRGGSGFSFDDLAADRAGIRFAKELLSATPEEMPSILAHLKQENDVFPNIAGLPSGLSERDFRKTYGDVDSPAYKRMLAMIEKRIDDLKVHAAR